MAMDALSRYLLTDKPEDDGVSVDDIGTYEDTTTQPELMRAISRDANASKRAFTQTPAYTLEQLFAGETEPGVVPAKGEAFAPATMRPPHRFPKLRSLGEGVTAPLEAPSETMDIPALPPEMPGALKAPTMTPPKMGETRESLGASLGAGRLTSPIPVASVPIQRDAAAPTTGVIAPTTGARAAEGAGGDTDEMDRLSSAANWIRAMETAGSAISGKNLRSGIAESLADRMKQVEALRLKKTERAEELAREDEQSASLVQQYKSLAAQGLVPDLPLLDKLPPKQAASLIKTYGSLGGMKAREQKTQAEIPQVEARTEDLRAGAELKKAKTPEVTLEGESKRLKREQDAAIGWARVNQASAEAAARAAASLASTAASQAEAKAVTDQLGRIEKIIKGAGYTPLIASLEQADQAISDLGRPPTATAQLKHALPGGDRFLSPEEKAYYNSVDKLKQMEQLAISGKVVSLQEREEFIRQYGTNWYANPAAAEAYINMLRKKTARQIDLDLASVRASPAGKKAVEAYAREGGVTSALPVFKGATAAARPEKPATAPAGKTVLWNVAEGKWKAIPNENAEAAVASGKYER